MIPVLLESPILLVRWPAVLEPHRSIMEVPLKRDQDDMGHFIGMHYSALVEIYAQARASPEAPVISEPHSEAQMVFEHVFAFLDFLYQIRWKCLFQFPKAVIKILRDVNLIGAT